MSILHYIKTEKKFKFKRLFKELKRNYLNIEFEERTENLYYLWLSDFSARGVDISVEKENWVELRNTILSSEADYQLTELTATIICALFKGKVFIDNQDFDSKNDPPELAFNRIKLPLFDDIFKELQYVKDVQTMGYMIEANQGSCGIQGPFRQAQFGLRFFNEMKDESIKEQADHVMRTLLRLNYNYIGMGYGNVIRLGQEDDPIVVKLITNKQNTLIDKYDFILFQGEDEEPIAITNDTLNTILPESWILLDEYNIFAPVLKPDEFDELKRKAEEINEIDYFELRLDGGDIIR